MKRAGIVTIGLIAAAVVALLMLGGRSATSSSNVQAEIAVYAAASLGDVLPQLVEGSGLSYGSQIRFNFAGSNVLAQQIVASNQADIYISANERWMDYVDEHPGTTSRIRNPFVSNQLVIIANGTTTWTIDDPAELAAIPVRHLSIGDPNAVPAGAYAMSYLKEIPLADQSLWDHFQEKVVPAPDVRAALNLVAATSDIIGIVYRTDAMDVDSVRIIYEIPPADAPPVQYFAAVIDRPDANPNVDALYEYLLSDEAASVLEMNGFVVSDTRARDE